MSVSIKWPDSFNDYIEQNNIYGEILLNYDLPYFLNTKEACYEMELDTEFLEGFPNKSRKMLINVERKWNENQGVALRGSTFSVGDRYGFQSSSIQIFIQIYEEEMDLINDLFKDINNFQEIMQKSLELFIIKYNINMNGNHFVTPSVSDCSMRCIFLYKNWLRFKEDINGHISPNVGSCTHYEMDEHIYNDSLEVDIYKYFLNKARYSKRNFDYIDTIVSGAIALESFVYSTIRCFLKSEEEVDAYTFDNKKEKYYSVNQLIRKLIKDNYIINKNAISNTILAKHISNVLSPRNDLMHGKLRNLEGLNSRAKKSFESLSELFDNLDINIEIRKPTINNNEIIISQNRQCVKNIINESLKLNSIDKIDKLKQGLEFDSKSSVIYMYIGIEYLNLGNFDKGMEYLEEALKYTEFKDEIYYYIGIGFTLVHDFYKAIETFKLVKNKPQRNSEGFCVNSYNLKLGECYFYLSKYKSDEVQDNKSKEEYLQLAIETFSKIKDTEIYTNIKYINLARAYMDNNEYLKALTCAEKVLVKDLNNYEMLLIKSFCLLIQGNIKECISSIESLMFIDKYKLDIETLLLLIINMDNNHKDYALKLLKELRNNNNRV
ncbi:hypothetical protein [Paraclostridium sordellii]|uniref:tetratricopeptide repeat protein n=1 Tax=Paraclostridium sordellii TaxID=1505 RepID=UPI0030CFB804